MSKTAGLATSEATMEKEVAWLRGRLAVRLPLGPRRVGNVFTALDNRYLPTTLSMLATLDTGQALN